MSLPKLHRGHLFAACGFLVPTLAVYLSGMLMPLLILMALLVLGLAFRRQEERLKISWIAVAFFAVLALWGATTALWSVAPERSVSQALSLVGIAACGLVLLAGVRTLGPADRRRIGMGLLTGLGVASLFMAVEIWAGFPFYTHTSSRPPTLDLFNRWTTIATLLIWPVLLWVGQNPKPWRIAAVLIPAFLVLVQMESIASLIALVLGTIAFFLAFHFPKRAVIALICLTMAGVVLAPILPKHLPDPRAIWAAAPSLPGSAIHRIYIWKFVAERIEERPFQGWGLDTARNIPNKGHMIWAVGDGGESLPLHPHNAVLQWWMEIGLPGAVIGGLFIVWLFVMILRRRMAPYPHAVFTGCLASAVTVALFGYGIWQTWWLATLFLTAVLLLGIAEKETRQGPTPCRTLK